MAKALEHNVCSSTIDVLSEVAVERVRQDQRWGKQNHPDGTSGKSVCADLARKEADEAAKAGTLTWFHVLEEEFCEADAETEPAGLRAELVQVAAVAVAWIEAIDRRKANA